MSDETNTQAPATLPETLTASRNNANLEFKQQEIKRGPGKGTTYFGPNCYYDEKAKRWVNWEAVVAYLGDELQKMVLPKFAQKSQGWTDEAFDWEKITNDKGDKEDVRIAGSFSQEKFLKFATDFAARGDSKSELEEERNDAIASLGDLDADNADHVPQILLLMKDIKRISDEIAAKKRDRKAKTESNGATVAAAK